MGTFAADFTIKEHESSSGPPSWVSLFCAILFLPELAASQTEILSVFVSCSVFSVSLLSPQRWLAHRHCKQQSGLCPELSKTQSCGSADVFLPCRNPEHPSLPHCQLRIVADLWQQSVLWLREPLLPWFWMGPSSHPYTHPLTCGTGSFLWIAENL